MTKSWYAGAHPWKWHWWSSSPRGGESFHFGKWNTNLNLAFNLELGLNHRLKLLKQQGIQLTAAGLTAMTLRWLTSLHQILYLHQKAWKAWGHDDQVVKLSRPALFNSHVQPLCLPSLAPSLLNTTVSMSSQPNCIGCNFFGFWKY